MSDEPNIAEVEAISTGVTGVSKNIPGKTNSL